MATKRLKRTFPSKEEAIKHMYAGGTSSDDLSRYFKGIHKPEISEAMEEMIKRGKIHIR